MRVRTWRGDSNVQAESQELHDLSALFFEKSEDSIGEEEGRGVESWGECSDGEARERRRSERNHRWSKKLEFFDTEKSLVGERRHRRRKRRQQRHKSSPWDGGP